MTAPSSPLNISKRYPTNPITPVGACHLMTGDQPIVAYRSYDDAIVFNMMGPLSIWDPTTPESIRLQNIKGLIPPWKNIRQKGATQDGSTYITSLYDELQVDLTVMARGRDAAHTRKLIRDWINSWDAKQPGTLSWFTPELGYWWAKTRFAKAPLDALLGGNFTRQKFTWTAECDDSFWRSYDSTDVFAFSYLSQVDHFNYNSLGSGNLGSNWTIHYTYTGSGSGFMYADGTEATSTLAGGAYAVAQRAGYVSGSDEQIITFTIGPIDPWPASTSSYLDVWARMANGGTPGQNGVRLRIGYQAPGGSGKGAFPAAAFLELSYFVSGVKTVLREMNVSVPWQPTDQISLAVGGFNGQAYSYFVQRGTNSSTGSANVTWQNLLTVVNPGPDGSLVGAGYRGAGFGMEVTGFQIAPTVIGWTAGDSTAAEESGYLTLYNAGDQVAYPYYILVGPGLFGIGDGPNATQAVTYGPLEQNQMVVIQTDPRKYGVTDLTSSPPLGTPATSQFLTSLAAAQSIYQSFLAGGTGAAAPQLSVFGTPFPQGNPYALLQGRFSQPLAAKLPGAPVAPQQIAVAVESGGPSTAILAGVTPLRRYPA
jgi:hypothetical protein